MGAKKFAHYIVDVKGREVIAKCGVKLHFRAREAFTRCTAWKSEVTCPKCKKGTKRA